MSKLTAKKIRKCREVIRSLRKFKRYKEGRDNMKYSYSDIYKRIISLEYLNWKHGLL